ncbi:MAG TPA: hypothetical protein VF583_15305 [Bradyrhizobium sp.]
MTRIFLVGGKKLQQQAPFSAIDAAGVQRSGEISGNRMAARLLLLW